MRKVKIPSNIESGSITFINGGACSLSPGAVIELEDSNADALLSGFEAQAEDEKKSEGSDKQ